MLFIENKCFSIIPLHYIKDFFIFINNSITSIKELPLICNANLTKIIGVSIGGYLNSLWKHSFWSFLKTKI